ncbi:hypothetical protein [Aliarcobacter butzleri]|uniref:hypothetical protein n=1 Tax=Aliarcobacter butzleri TaxID=28197 RepID=UPI003AFAB1AF
MGFLKELLKMFILELDKNNFLNIHQIVIKSLKTIVKHNYPYLSYYFNDKKIKAEIKKVKYKKDISKTSKKNN